MKKILIVFNHPAPYKVRLFNELSKKFELHVIFERSKARDRNKKFYFEEKYNFITHKIKGINVGKEGFVSNGVVKHLKRNKYDLIIMNGYSHFAEMRAIKYLKKQKLPYVFYINGGIINKTESNYKKKLKTKYISGAAAYFSPDKQSNKYLEYYGADSNLIFNYPYSTIYDSEITKKEIDKMSERKKLNLSFDKLFVSSGQLIERKNYLTLVKEWKNYPKNYGLLLIGDGPLKEKISSYISENNMKNIILLGFLSKKEMFNYFKISDCFLFPSKEDIYGHVINEALSQGIPVISSKNVNSALKLINEKNGLLIDEFEGKKLKDAIEKVINSGPHFNSCIETAKQNTIEIMAKNHAILINEVLEK